MAQVSGTGRGKHFRPSSSRKIGFAFGLLIAVLGGLFVSLASSAGAATEATVAKITDYATYPQDGLIPVGCNQQGAGVLVGISYTITHNGVDRVSTNLSAEQLFIGDTVKMSWTDYAAGCEGIGVSLAVKSTDHNVFVLTDNQKLVSYQYCSGTDCGGNGQGFGNLTIQVPSKQDACNFQFDAVIGPPLDVIGPNGSYYSSDSRNNGGKAHPTDRNMLIGASNGGKGECIAPTVASATQSCNTEGGPSVDVAIENLDTNDVATVDVLKDGTVVHSGVQVPVGQTVHSFVPFDVQETATVSVNWTDSAGPVDPVKEIFTQEFIFDCIHPGATISHTCDEGVQIHFTNTGDSALEMTVTKGGNVIDTVPVPGNGTADRTYAMAEDETATYRVTGGGFDSGDQEFTHDCVEPSTTTTTTEPDTVQGTEIVRGTTLPRTGSSSTLPMSTVAGLLLMTGGLLLALVNRPMPATAHTTTSRRSRGR